MWLTIKKGAIQRPFSLHLHSRHHALLEIPAVADASVSGPVGELFWVGLAQNGGAGSARPTIMAPTYHES